jgi:Predicted periplasmic ligand-binding sensor domain
LPCHKSVDFGLIIWFRSFTCRKSTDTKLLFNTRALFKNRTELPYKSVIFKDFIIVGHFHERYFKTFDSILIGKIANLPPKERKMKKTALLALLIAFILPSFAQERPARFRNFSTDDGLPDNSVRSIFQDSNGLIWLCTREGICMYDGLHFKPLEDPNCDILDGLAMSLMEDRQHRLWFVTTLGIGFHDLETGENRTVRRSAARGLVGAADIAVDRNGMVWIANEDIFCWDPTRQQLIDYSPVALFTSNTVEADSNGSVWFLATSGDLYRFSKVVGGKAHRG